MSKKLSISKAIGEALHEEMARDENVIIMGEDMGKMGNVFRDYGWLSRRSSAGTACLIPRFPESGFCGMAVGAAMRGIRPVVELMYDDFITVAADPIHQPGCKDEIYDRRTGNRTHGIETARWAQAVETHAACGSVLRNIFSATHPV